MTDRPKPAPGLCERCRWARLVRTPRSAFWQCLRAREDPHYERYPRLPVLNCGGHEALLAGETVPEGPAPREEK